MVEAFGMSVGSIIVGVEEVASLVFPQTATILGLLKRPLFGEIIQ